MAIESEFMNMCEQVFVRTCGWPEANEDILAQRRSVFEAFSRDQGWTLVPIECSGGKSTMARVYTLLDVGQRWLVAVKTIADCRDFVEGMSRYKEMFAEGESRFRTIGASHSEMSIKAREQAAKDNDVLVICHESLKIAMTNPSFAEKLGIADRKICIDEDLSLTSSRNHNDKEIERFTKRLRRFVGTSEGAAALEDMLLTEDFEQDMADIDWAYQVVADNEIQDTFIEGFLSYSVREGTDGKEFPRCLDSVLKLFMTKSVEVEDWDDEHRLAFERRMNSIISIASGVITNVGLAIRTNDDSSADSYGRVFRGTSLVPASWTQAVVLDGTAEVRPRVAQSMENPLGSLVQCESRVQEVTRIRDYSNVTIDIVSGAITSPRRLHLNDRESHRWMHGIINEALAEGNSKKTFILGSESLVKNLAKDRKDLYWNAHHSAGMPHGQEGLADSKLILGYWNRHHRGTNDFMSCDRGFTFSLLNKPYWCAALPVLIARGGTGDLDEFLEEVRQEELGALAAEIIQGVNRIKHRGLLIEDGKLKTPEARFTIFVHNTPEVGCLDGERRDLAGLISWLIQHEMPGVQINEMSMEDSTSLPGVPVAQASVKKSGQRGVGKKWEPLLDAVQQGLSTDNEYEITDSGLLDLCPFLGSLDKARDARKNLLKRGSLKKGLDSRGLKVSIESVRGRGFLVSKAA